MDAAVSGGLVDEAIARIWANVLGLEKVSVQDDFLSLGGNSLQALQVIARMETALGLEISLYDFLQQPTADRIARRSVRISQAVPRIEHSFGSDYAPLSEGQQQLWFIDQLEGGSAAYHVPVAIRIRGKLDRTALQATLDALVKRHEVFRTVFVIDRGDLSQKISSDGECPLRIEKLKVPEGADSEEETLAVLVSELSGAFDLGIGPLMRAMLLQVSGSEHVLLLCMHHIITDGWSTGVLLREFEGLYRSYCSGAPDPLPPLPLQYGDYTRWQQQWLQSSQFHEQMKYWRLHLQGAPDVLALPVRRPRAEIRNHAGASASLSIESRLTAEIRTLAKRSAVTPSVVLHSAWAILLWKVSGQDDIVVGIPVANRPRIEFESMIGYFVNMLAVRTHIHARMPLTEFLYQVKEVLFLAYSHQRVPFVRVVQELRPIRSLSYTPVFQVALGLQNTPHYVPQLPGLTVLRQYVPSTTAQFDLTLALEESIGGISGQIKYASDLFDGKTVETWVELYCAILRAMTLNPEGRVGDSF